MSTIIISFHPREVKEIKEKLDGLWADPTITFHDTLQVEFRGERKAPKTHLNYAVMACVSEHSIQSSNGYLLTFVPNPVDALKYMHDNYEGFKASRVCIEPVTQRIFYAIRTDSILYFKFIYLIPIE